MSTRVYAILRNPGTVAHLAPGPFGRALCGRRSDMTSNVPGGRRLCKDCARIGSEGRES